MSNTNKMAIVPVMLCFFAMGFTLRVACFRWSPDAAGCTSTRSASRPDAARRSASMMPIAGAWFLEERYGEIRQRSASFV